MPAPDDIPGRPALRSQGGQTIVEFALVLPILLLLIFGAFDLARAFGFWNDVNQIAGERARAAAVGREPDEVGAGTTTDTSGIPVDVDVCLPEGSAGEPGDAVRVETAATFEHVGVVAAILGLTSDGQITGAAEMRLERPGPYPECG